VKFVRFPGLSPLAVEWSFLAQARWALLLLLLLPSATEAGLPGVPVERWRWEGAVEDPERTWPTVVVAAPLTDDDGDGDVDLADGADIAFIHQKRLDNDLQALTAVEGRSGNILFHVTSPAFGAGTTLSGSAVLAIGDVDGDGLNELLTSSKEGPGPAPAPAALIAFENDGAFAWSRDWPGTVANYGQALALADLNQDGVVEALLAGTVLSVDGSLGWTRSDRMPGTRADACFTHAVDLDPSSPGLEVLYGHGLFTSTGEEIWQNTLLPMGATGVGDVDGDGDPEIVLTSRDTIWLLDHLGNVLGFDLSWLSGTPWPRPSAPTLADFDGDGRDEVVVAGNFDLWCFEWDGLDLSVVWRMPINDETGLTGAVAYDFDGDGASEVLYRDQDSWFVIDGSDGTVLHEERFPSRTGTEAPIVVSLDGCSATVIVSGFGDLQTNDVGAYDAVIAYDVPDSAVPRAVWNQRTYHVTNVLDRGEIPRVEASPWPAGRGWQGQVGETARPGPSFDTASVRDPTDCNLGLELAWLPAIPSDPLAEVVYDVFRSTALPQPSCEDALRQPPVAVGIEATRWFDRETLAGRWHVYVVQARELTAQGCAAPASVCLDAILEQLDPPVPDGVYATLRAEHVEQEVIFTWAAARPLLPEEHFHLLKATDSPTNPFMNVLPEAMLGRVHSENDTSSALQFFDLRVANGCEALSLDEYPASR